MSWLERQPFLNVLLKTPIEGFKNLSKEPQAWTSLSIPSSTVAKPFLWKRVEIASALVRAQAMEDMSVSQGRCAVQIDVPRSTLQNWERNQRRLNRDGQLKATEVQFFLQPPQGLAVLHRMLVALHLVFGQSHDC